AELSLHIRDLRMIESSGAERERKSDSFAVSERWHLQRDQHAHRQLSLFPLDDDRTRERIGLERTRQASKAECAQVVENGGVEIVVEIRIGFDEVWTGGMGTGKAPRIVRFDVGEIFVVVEREEFAPRVFRAQHPRRSEPVL